jgi:hypothetical protein
MLADIDCLPHSPESEIRDIVVNDGTGLCTEYLCARNPVDIVRELIGNPRFKEHMRYAPERHWTSKAKDTRIYSEMWTGNWWWRTQVSTANDSDGDS